MGDIGEGAVAVVVIEDILAALEARRPTCYLNSFVSTSSGLWKRCCLDIEVYVVGDKQIEMAVAVVVEKGAAGVPPCLRLQQARLLCDIRESSIAVVTVENVLAVVADKQIVPAIVVVVADTAALTPSAAGEASFDGDIGECAVAIVLE